mmetsp:Transcript_3288/g.14943  ORF Transcript_3288/g.14943 Transcript_3288/m.14943 type:complete len:317 (-) Transcript_3288:1391-2341(-)
MAIARERLLSPAHSEGRRPSASSMASFLTRAGRMRSSLGSTRVRRNFWSVSNSTPNRSTRTAASSSVDGLRKSAPRSAGSVLGGASDSCAERRSSNGPSCGRTAVSSVSSSSGSGNDSYILSDASVASRSGAAASKSSPDLAPAPNHRRRNTNPLTSAASPRVNAGDHGVCDAFIETFIAAIDFETASATPAADAGDKNPDIAEWSLIAGCRPAHAPAAVVVASTYTPAARSAPAVSFDTPVESIVGAPSGMTAYRIRSSPSSSLPSFPLVSITGSNGNPSSLPSEAWSKHTDPSTRHTSARYSSDVTASSQGTGV